MGNIASDVTAPIEAMAQLSTGVAAKNSTMKDGKPENTEEETKEGDKKGTTKTHLEKYGENVEKAWDDYEKHGDKTLLGLHIGKAVTDLAMGAGPAVLKLLGDLANKK